MMALLQQLFTYTSWIALIEFGGTLIIVGYLVAAGFILLKRRAILPARILIAEGILWGLNFKVAASLLKTIVIHSWQQIAFFAVIFALRTVLKQIFTWERAVLLHEVPTMPHAE